MTVWNLYVTPNGGSSGTYANDDFFVYTGTLDRFDLLAKRSLSKPARALVSAVRTIPPLRLLAHMASEGTTVWAVRNRP